MLHGIGATGDYFGAFYDGLSRRRRVLIVDLLGFGHSIDDDQASYELDDHVDALDSALEDLDLARGSMVIAAHSTAAAIALSWANAHREHVRRLYLWGPTIYPDAAAGAGAAKQLGVMSRLLLSDARWAQWLYRRGCERRELSGQLLGLASPRRPMQMSGDAVRHTQVSLDGSIQSLLLHVAWGALLPAAVPVTVFHGEHDLVGDRAMIARLFAHNTIISVPDADHHVALQHPKLLFDAIDQQ